MGSTILMYVFTILLTQFDIEWQKTIDFPFDVINNSKVIKTDDHYFIYFNYYDTEDTVYYPALLSKNLNCEIEWVKTYNISIYQGRIFSPLDFVYDKLNGFYLVGRNYLNNENLSSDFVLHTNDAGDSLGIIIFDNISDLQTIYQMGSNNYLIGGDFIGYIDSNLNINWINLYAVNRGGSYGIYNIYTFDNYIIFTDRFIFDINGNAIDYTVNLPEGVYYKILFEKDKIYYFGTEYGAHGNWLNIYYRTRIDAIFSYYYQDSYQDRYFRTITDAESYNNNIIISFLNIIDGQFLEFGSEMMMIDLNGEIKWKVSTELNEIATTDFWIDPVDSSFYFFFKLSLTKAHFNPNFINAISTKITTVAINYNSNQLGFNYDNTPAENITIKIFDLNGRIVKLNDNSISKSRNKYNIDISNLPSGVYFVYMKTVKETFSKKIIITR